MNHIDPEDFKSQIANLKKELERHIEDTKRNMDNCIQGLLSMFKDLEELANRISDSTDDRPLINKPGQSG